MAEWGQVRGGAVVGSRATDVRWWWNGQVAWVLQLTRFLGPQGEGEGGGAAALYDLRRDGGSRGGGGVCG